MTLLFMSWPGFRGHQVMNRREKREAALRVHLVHQGNGS
ncbi:MAG: hypothetical protein OJF50_004981 [Nitrospira sp.]|jgi:hypothetical protein|nr:hypothetical protein [Nitrospira sp.]